MIDGYLCKYHSGYYGRKNGKACIVNPDNPKRCDDVNCKDYEEDTEMLDNWIEKMNDPIRARKYSI